MGYAKQTVNVTKTTVKPAHLRRRAQAKAAAQIKTGALYAESI